MKKVVAITLFALVAWVAGSAIAAAQTSTTASVTVSATVSNTVKLTVSSATVSFPDADPDTTTILSAAALDVAAKAKTSAGSGVSLTVVAGDDLKSGTDVIGIGNLTWTATGAGFSAGTMVKSGSAALGAWTGSGAYTGTQTYKLANSWNYATGSYSTTVTYTLSIP